MIDTYNIYKTESYYGKMDTLFSLIIVLLPFLHQYKGIGSIVSFGELLLVPFVLYYSITIIRDRCITPNKPLLLIYFFSILGVVVNYATDYFELSSAITVVMRLLFYGIIIYSAKSHFNINSVVRFYSIASVVASVYLIIQFIIYHTSGTILPIYFNYSWLFPPEARAVSLTKYFDVYRAFRASSLFLEPGYYALFCIPNACILMLKTEKKNKDRLNLMIVFTGLILSESMAGLGAIIIILGCYLFFVKRKEGGLFKILVIICMLLILGFMIFSEVSSLNIVSRVQSGGSFNYRVTRGIIIYEKLPLFHKIFGVGLNNIQAFMQTNGLSTPFDETNLNACCTILQTLNFSGIFAFIALLGYNLQEYRKSYGPVSRAMTLIMFYIMCYESILFSFRFAFLTIMIIGIKNLEQEGSWNIR